MAELLQAYKVQHVGQDPHSKKHVIYLPGKPQIGSFLFSRSERGSAFYTIIAIEEYISIEGNKAKSGVCGILTVDAYRSSPAVNNLMGKAEFGPPPVMPAPTLKPKHAVTSKLQPNLVLVDQTNARQTPFHEYQRTGQVTLQIGEVLTVNASGQPRQYAVKSVVWLYNRDASQQPIVYIGVEPLDHNYVDFISTSRPQAFSPPPPVSAPPSGRSSAISMLSRPPMPLPRSAYGDENLYEPIDEPPFMSSRTSSFNDLSSGSSISRGRSSASSGYASSSPRIPSPSVNQVITFLAEAVAARSGLTPAARKNLAAHADMLIDLQGLIVEILAESNEPSGWSSPRQPRRLVPIKSLGDTEAA